MREIPQGSAILQALRSKLAMLIQERLAVHEVRTLTPRIEFHRREAVLAVMVVAQGLDLASQTLESESWLEVILGLLHLVSYFQETREILQGLAIPQGLLSIQTGTLVQELLEVGTLMPRIECPDRCGAVLGGHMVV